MYLSILLHCFPFVHEGAECRQLISQSDEWKGRRWWACVLVSLRNPNPKNSLLFSASSLRLLRLIIWSVAHIISSGLYSHGAMVGNRRISLVFPSSIVLLLTTSSAASTLFFTYHDQLQQECIPLTAEVGHQSFSDKLRKIRNFELVLVFHRKKVSPLNAGMHILVCILIYFAVSSTEEWIDEERLTTRKWYHLWISTTTKTRALVPFSIYLRKQT